MEDDKIVKMSKPITDDMYTTPDVPPGVGVIDVLSPDFGDYEALWNSRQWLENALVAKGATITGASCGMGEADLGIILEGMEYIVSIRPRIKG